MKYDNSEPDKIKESNKKVFKIELELTELDHSVFISIEAYNIAVLDDYTIEVDSIKMKFDEMIAGINETAAIGVD